MIVALLTQGTAAAYHAVAMAVGTEVCSAEGSKHVDEDGHVIKGQGMHDCCCPSVATAPPPSVDPVMLATGVTLPESDLPLPAFAAQWLGPLSRGPPALSLT